MMCLVSREMTSPKLTSAGSSRRSSCTVPSNRNWAAALSSSRSTRPSWRRVGTNAPHRNPGGRGIGHQRKAEAPDQGRVFEQVGAQLTQRTQALVELDQVSGHIGRTGAGVGPGQGWWAGRSGKCAQSSGPSRSRYLRVTASWATNSGSAASGWARRADGAGSAARPARAWGWVRPAHAGRRGPRPGDCQPRRMTVT